MASTAPVAEPVPATETAAEPIKEDTKSKRTYKKRKNAVTTAPPPVEAATPADALQPLPEDATGFRKRSKKEVRMVASPKANVVMRPEDTDVAEYRSQDYTPVPSSSVPGMSVGEVRHQNVDVDAELCEKSSCPYLSIALWLCRLENL